MCRTFYDVRTFGAVMSTGKAGDEDAEPKATKGKDQAEKKKPPGVQKLWNCGQVRGRAYVEPVMFLVASTIEEATEYRDLLVGPDMLGSADQVLSDVWIRNEYPPAGKAKAARPGDSPTDRYDRADQDANLGLESWRHGLTIAN